MCPRPRCLTTWVCGAKSQLRDKERRELRVQTCLGVVMPVMTWSVLVAFPPHKTGNCCYAVMTGHLHGSAYFEKWSKALEEKLLKLAHNQF